MGCRSYLGTASTIAAIAFAMPAHAEPEDAGDHPMVPRITGSEILSYDFTDLDRVSLTFGPREDGEFEEARELEGEHTQLMYILRNPDVSSMQIKRAYTQGLEGAGFEIVFSGSGDELGRRFHRFDTFDRSRPRGTSVQEMGWQSNKDDMRFIAASHTEEDVYLNALIFPNRDDGSPVLRLDVVEKPAEEPTIGVSAPEPTERQPVDRGEIVAAHEAEDLSAADMEASMVAEGRVAVRDILFEFDSADIIDESADALATIADFLDKNDDLELVIVGHTDNVGNFDYNLSLSMDRARAVSSWLEGRHGIDEDRLQPAGAGMMAPVATNRTEDGRSQNRRVELVER